MQSERVAIVTDSAADIPGFLLEQYSIYVVPCILMIGDQTFEDGVQISRDEYYQRLPEMDPLPTTATPSISKFHDVYEKVLSSGFSHILSLHAASKLSGIFSAASTAANDFNGHVKVFDSRFLTLGLGFQCLEAAEAVVNGESLEDVTRMLEKLHHRARVIAMLDTLEYVRRSGRVSWAKAQIGELLKLKPFVEVCDGNVNNLGQTRTRRKGIERLIELIQRQAPLKRLAILHTNAEEDARGILTALDPEIPTEPLIINVTTIIGTHVGPKGLGFAGLTYS
jgi:DegV family protein with EDD domain